MVRAQVWMVVLLCAVVAPCEGQRCEPFYPSSLTSICTPVLPSGLVWIPPTGSQALVEKTFESNLILVKSIQSIAPLGCYAQLLSLLCNTAFPTCSSNFTNSTSTANSTSPTNSTSSTNPATFSPVPACKSTCESVNEECSSLWRSSALAPLNCSQLSPVTAAALWPKDNTQNCFTHDKLPALKTSLSVSSCPFPLIHVDNPTIEDTPCALPCPDPTMSRRQWKMLGVAMFVCTTIGATLMSFLCIYFVVCPDCRNPFGRFQLYTFLHVMIWELSVSITGPYPMNEVWCENTTTPASIDDIFCGTQGVLFTFFGLGASIWLAVSSMVIYKRIIRPHYVITTRREIVYTAVGVGIPFILTVIPSRLKMIQFYWRAPVCFVQGDVGTFSYHYIFFYIPLAIATLVAIGYTCAAVVKISLHVRSMNKIFKNTETLTGMKPLWDANFRLVIWCAVMAAVFVTLVVYRLVLGNKEFITNWIRCKIMSEIGLGSNAECPETIVPNSVSFVGTMTHFVIVPSMGTFSFLVSGTKMEIYHFWHSLARAMVRREWDVAWEIVTLSELEKRDKNRKKNTSTTATPFPSWRVRTLKRALKNLPSILLLPFATFSSSPTEELIPPHSETSSFPHPSTLSPASVPQSSTLSSTPPLTSIPCDSPV